MELKDVLGYSLVSMPAIYVIYKSLKAIKNNYSHWHIERLRKELNHDLQILSSLPRGDYVTLNDTQQIQVDDAEDLLQITKEKYSANSLDHLWNSIPKGPERNELELKERRIKSMLERLTAREVDFN